MATTINIHEAKTHLSRLLVRVAGGEEVIIARNGQPVARLISVTALPSRVPGRFRGQIHGVESLLETADTAEVALWTEGHRTDPLSEKTASSKP
ncbi:hypothetical protein BH11VER1_BH11VER1_38110 [soil metagenome]